MTTIPPKAPLTCDASPVKGVTVDVGLVMALVVGVGTPELAAVVAREITDETVADDPRAEGDAEKEATCELVAGADELGAALLFAGADDELPEPGTVIGTPAD
ncbi:MAG: hypothetical protein M1830_004716 [Pleopsidium flavum]|nr:MAG: hypothetical protein M1830_004716 [Pleopsidium flavum]